MRYRLPLIIILAAAMAALAAGCGRSGSISSGSGPDATQSGGTFDLASASAATSKAGSAKLSFDMKMSGGSLGSRSLAFTGDGAFDLGRHRGEMTLDMSRLSSGLKIDEIVDGTTVYMHTPSVTRGMPGSPEWLKLDLSAVGRDQGIDMTALMSGNGGGIDPSKYLDQLEATSGSVERRGTDTVRGTTTTRYHAVVDYDKLPDIVPAAKRAAARRSVASLEKLSGLKEAPVDVWVDGEHRVRRVDFTMDMKPTEGALAGKSAHIEVTMDFYDFGTPVDVDIPSPDETRDVTGELDSSGRSLSTP